MSAKMKKTFSREIQNLDAAGLLRTETAVSQTTDMEAHFGGNKSLLNFIGNDLLGWSSNGAVQEDRDLLPSVHSGDLVAMCVP